MTTQPNNPKLTGDITNNSGWVNINEQPDTSILNDRVFVRQAAIAVLQGLYANAGELVSQTGDQAILKNSRRLWSWTVKGEGVALSGVAQSGLATASKVDAINPEIALTGVIETIPATQAAKESINGF